MKSKYILQGLSATALLVGVNGLNELNAFNESNNPINTLSNRVNKNSTNRVYIEDKNIYKF